MLFNTENGFYIASFIYDASITEPTLLFKSTEYYYSNGYSLFIYDQNGVTLKSTQVHVGPRASFKNDIEILILDKNLNG